ncbi:uncharacterized protein LOC129893385 [Solanum dulcamara]|uniref:uncharacterized protein LOC129893385 n=1 Tax=Solanum dulcamara TaxID=45834 RepID=UPI0024856A0C|nr:uncharacterized protein LOC129893385 [Solanum dulcamara]
MTNSDVVPPGNDLVEHSHAVQPVHDPIWRGCYNIWNNKEYVTLNGVVAHLSVKASQTVSEKAKLLALYLHFEMVPKSYLWPKCFNTSEATDDDIELYFFPSEARHKQEFDRLVEDMIGGEHALQAFTPFRELLVFTSTELPLRHWRYQQKYYLWGVFRATHGSSSRKMISNGIQSGMVRQTPETLLANRDKINVDNNSTPTEVDTPIMTDVLRRGKRIRKIARLADYDYNQD